MTDILTDDQINNLDQAASEATQQGLSPSDYQATLMAENQAKSEGASSSGAIGPAQLLPSTAKGLNVDPTNPSQNVHGGAVYLKQMYDKYKGDPVLAHMAYQWGPGNVDTWIANGSNADDVPKTTKNYVNDILKNGHQNDAYHQDATILTDADIDKLDQQNVPKPIIASSSQSIPQNPNFNSSLVGKINTAGANALNSAMFGGLPNFDAAGHAITNTALKGIYAGANAAGLPLPGQDLVGAIPNGVDAFNQTKNIAQQNLDISQANNPNIATESEIAGAIGAIPATSGGLVGKGVSALAEAAPKLFTSGAKAVPSAMANAGNRATQILNGIATPTTLDAVKEVGSIKAPGAYLSHEASINNAAASKMLTDAINNSPFLSGKISQTPGLLQMINDHPTAALAIVSEMAGHLGLGLGGIAAMKAIPPIAKVIVPAAEGINATSKISATLNSQDLDQNQQQLGKYYPILKQAAQNGGNDLAVKQAVLSQRDPAFNELMMAIQNQKPLKTINPIPTDEEIQKQLKDYPIGNNNGNYGS